MTRRELIARMDVAEFMEWVAHDQLTAAEIEFARESNR